MTRIISEKINKKLSIEYKLRFLSILFLVLAVVIFVNISLVSSSYLLLSLYEKAYTKNETSSQIEQTLKLREEFETKLAQVYAVSKKIPQTNNSFDTKIVHTLIDYAGKNIELESIEILQEDPLSKITIRGLATTREDLIQLQNTIKQDENFSDFSIPIESLAKQRDVSFNVTFTYHEN